MSQVIKDKLFNFTTPPLPASAPQENESKSSTADTQDENLSVAVEPTPPPAADNTAPPGGPATS